MKKIIAILTLITMMLVSVPAFADEVGIIKYSANTDSAIFTLTKDQLDRDHTDSTLRYYVFSVNGIVVRANKNNFYDHDLDKVEFSVGAREFSVKFTYSDKSTVNVTDFPIAMHYTVSGDDITEYSVPVFGNKILTVDKADAKKMEFSTTAAGKFSVKNYEFSDVKDASKWYYKYINTCAAYGILSGMGDGTFKPSDHVTRAQLAVMIVRSTDNVISYRIDEKLKFDDVAKGKWYYDAIMKCATMGIVFGKTEKQFAPDEPATREQIAAVVARVVGILGSFGGSELPDASKQDELKTLYKDHASVSNYARSNVLLCNKLQIMVGDYGNFRPKSNTTRAECAVIFYKLKKSVI